ncbi:hypothetical protein DQ226_07525 [Dietzia maris]|uniref:Type II toxin-antitoxin system RelE/ParE family toxin n=1 Tax=Dietzia maris TaxID=37915 RepID=A0A365PAV4_9ACTN|nr:MULTISPECIES: hypothetical protein [unclassified Dietzia]MCY1656347.1 hypothetical protein [Dietzia sp. SL131]RBA37150.1 hypothetical protein DQ226_07525 [Dietzia maris]
MAPPFVLAFSVEAQQTLVDLKRPQHGKKKKKVDKALKLLQDAGPGYPGLNSHKLNGLTGPGGADLWDSYVENNTPSAWRIYWVYGDNDYIFVVEIGPHK